MKSLALRWLKRIGITLGAILGIATISFFVVNESLPEGLEGEQADSLARQMMQAINDPAWQSTGAVSWNFGNRRRHLWDRERHYAQVTWGPNLVVVDINRQDGVVLQKAETDKKPEAKLIREAWEMWVNDSFWLNPVSKVFDPGTSRRIVPQKDGQPGLLISYASGGATPGDSYLWLLDESARPRAWKLWVSIVPIGGLEFSWDNWQTLSTGVLVSGTHKSALFTLELTEFEAAPHLKDLVEGPDPFEALVKKFGEPANPREPAPEPDPELEPEEKDSLASEETP